MDEEVASPPKQEEDEKASSTDDAIRNIEANLSTWIPSSPDALRETPIFRSAYKAIQFQRDCYILGPDYAQWRQKNPHSDQLPSTAHGLAHRHLTHLGGSFLPSPTVRYAALPLVASLPTTVLYQPAKNGLIGIIQGQQDNVNSILKNQILSVLDNPNIRHSIKNSTQGFLSNKGKG